MATKQELYGRFGPELIEAVVDLMLGEINILRTQHGLALRTKQDVINSVESKLNSIDAYQ